MLKIGDQDAVNLLRFFDDLPDPRSKVNRLHRLGDVIVIAVCAVTASADGPTAIANWAKLNEPWLRKHLALPNGIPGKDTFRGITLGQVATEEKSNEITAIPQLLDVIDIENAIVTIDAAGCQKSIAAQVVDGKGDYVLALKANHGKLFDDVRLRLGCHMQDDFADCPVSRYVEVEKGHGRLEERRYYQMTAPSYLPGRSEWKGLKTIGAAVRIYEENGIQKSDTRYYLSSLRRNGKQFANAVRNHWGIENSLHWSLDMTYREDESRVRNRTFAENLSWLRRMTLSLIKQHPGKQSNIMKRRMAGWSVDFLMQILTGKRT
jgi:predicted transposase YbfD/YdcC